MISIRSRTNNIERNWSMHVLCPLLICALMFWLLYCLRINKIQLKTVRKYQRTVLYSTEKNFWINGLFSGRIGIFFGSKEPSNQMIDRSILIVLRIEWKSGFFNFGPEFRRFKISSPNFAQIATTSWCKKNWWFSVASIVD